MKNYLSKCLLLQTDLSLACIIKLYFSVLIGYDFMLHSMQSIFVLSPSVFAFQIEFSIPQRVSRLLNTMIFIPNTDYIAFSVFPLPHFETLDSLTN